jgi:pyruvate-formate lyase-activating enzyme
LKEYGITYQVPLDEVRGQLKHLHDHGARRVVFTGGEPSIHPDLVEIVHSAREIGYGNISIFTNARRMRDAELVGALIDAGLNTAMVSVHGRTSGAHDKTVRAMGAFDETIRGLSNLAKTGIYLVINTPITALNLSEIVSMYDFLAAIGGRVRRWQLSNIYPTAVMMNHPELHPGYESIQKIVFEVMARSRNGPLRCVTQEIPLCVVFPWLSESRELSDEKIQMICRRDRLGDYRRYRPWKSPYKSLLPTCEPCGMRNECGKIPLCYLMSHRDLSIFKPLEYLSAESWRRQMGILNC